MMAGSAARGLDGQGDDAILPVTWNEWLALPVCDQDRAVGSSRGAIRCPTVIVSSHYARVPMRRPGFNRCNLWQRDGGVCQYTGRKLAPHEGNIDHVVPRSRGGKASWANCVLALKNNSRKADRLPQEAGLRLLNAPVEPRALPATVLIQNAYGVRDWDFFLV
jgi:5-methylcytosine-specific restriction endonuclease McrA